MVHYALFYDTEKPSFFLTLDVLVGSRSEAQQVSMTECWLKHLAPQLNWSGNNALIVKHILQDVNRKIVVFKDICYLLQHHFLLQIPKNLHVSIVAPLIEIPSWLTTLRVPGAMSAVLDFLPFPMLSLPKRVIIQNRHRFWGFGCWILINLIWTSQSWHVEQSWLWCHHFMKDS